MVNTKPDTNAIKEMFEALEYAEDVLRTKVKPTLDSIACVTHLQAVIATAKWKNK